MSINKGRVAIVTGAGQGIGRGVAIRLAKEGARVVVCDIVEQTAKAVVDEITAAGGEAIMAVGDVGLRQDADAIAKLALDTWGTIDILVNNAGILRDAILHKMTEQQWDDVIRVNLKGDFLMIQAVYYTMRNQHYGRIINISSSACRGNVGQAHYASSKAAINALTETAALEMGRHGITVNAICPGTIETPMARASSKVFAQGVPNGIPVGRFGQPEDIAEAVVFFAGEGAGFISGQIIWVDGASQVGLKRPMN